MYVADQGKSLDCYVGKLGFTQQVDEEMWPCASNREEARIARSPVTISMRQLESCAIKALP